MRRCHQTATAPRTGPVAQASARVAAGFTLVELMVVMVILGTMLLIVPANIHKFGARSRLVNAANTLSSCVSFSRSQAIQDGHDVQFQVGIFKNGDGDPRHGYRWVISARAPQESELLNEDAKEKNRLRNREVEEWVELPWAALETGVEIKGVSIEENSWISLREDDPATFLFHPDGTVAQGFGIRVFTEDLDVKEDDRTMTVIVNPLTAESTVHEGPAEMPPLRDERDFIR